MSVLYSVSFICLFEHIILRPYLLSFDPSIYIVYECCGMRYLKHRKLLSTTLCGHKQQRTTSSFSTFEMIHVESCFILDDYKYLNFAFPFFMSGVLYISCVFNVFTTIANAPLFKC